MIRWNTSILLVAVSLHMLSNAFAFTACQVRECAETPDSAKTFTYQRTAVSGIAGVTAVELAPVDMGSGPFQFHVWPALPPGLTFNPSTGVINGLMAVPTQGAVYTVEVFTGGSSSTVRYAALWIEVLDNLDGVAAYKFVSPSGNDANPGTLAAPFQTIGQALKTMHAGQTLFLRGGLYREFVEIRGWWNLTLRSYPGEVAIIDASIPDFTQPFNSKWEPVAGVPGEFQSEPFSRFDSSNGLSRGAFISNPGEPYRRLGTYSRL
ncbi:MAG: hypothetical protein JWP08_2676, partial [Bryobacterales bacterium]|nr:hypothetical protein [Bryobacterales bacterium]